MSMSDAKHPCPRCCTSTLRTTLAPAAVQAQNSPAALHEAAGAARASAQRSVVALQAPSPQLAGTRPRRTRPSTTAYAARHHAAYASATARRYATARPRASVPRAGSGRPPSGHRAARPWARPCNARIRRPLSRSGHALHGSSRIPRESGRNPHGTVAIAACCASHRTTPEREGG
uniref:Uncharacterized protein n=1 Tax=Arundo donax TaxID=35708 RepID=A0A0A8XTE2_ARUDO